MSWPVPLKESMRLLSKSEAAVVCNLKFPGPPPGKYRLTIETRIHRKPPLFRPISN